MRWFDWKAGLMIIALAALFLWGPQQIGRAQSGDDVDAFVKHHWRLPVPPQGEAPAAFSPIEASLHPKECALCHRQQFNDWKTSLHSRSMGPGIYGQLLNMQENTPATYTICATCHTPLSEQIPHLKEGSEYRPNEAFDPELQEAGLICAGCHVRQHQRFGPPRRPELPPPSPEFVQPHGGFTATTAFQRSGVLQAVPPIRRGCLRPQRQAAGKHLCRVAGQSIRQGRRAMPRLPHAGPSPPVARHPGPGNGAAGDDGQRLRRWRPHTVRVIPCKPPLP